MKVTCESLPGSRVELTVEPEDEEYQKALERAWRQVANRVNIPGFRRGKAPKAIVMRAVGPDTVEEEALRLYLPQLYREAVSQANIEPLGDPKFDIAQRDPLMVKVTVAVRPKVKLGDYEQVRLTREEPRVTDAQIDAELEQLRHQHAEWVPVERPVAQGDLVTTDVEGFTGHRPLLYGAGGQELLHADKGDVILNEQDWAYPVDSAMGMPIPGFAEQLIGMNADEEKEFRLAVPGDDPRFENSKLAGKEITFRVKVKEIKEQHLPDVNDDFAKLVGSHENLEQLRSEMRDMLIARAAAEEEERLSELVVDMAGARSTLELPDELVDREVDRMMESLKRRLDIQNFSFQNFLQVAQKSEDELRREYRSQAERNIRGILVVDAIADADNIQVTPEEVEEEILRIGMAIGDGARAQREYGDPDNRANLEARLRYDKTVRSMVEHATQPESVAAPEQISEEAATEPTPPSAEGAES